MARWVFAAPGRLVRRRWLWLALFAALVAAGALAAPHVYAWQQLGAGRSAVEQFHADEARPHLDACLVVWPNDVEARLLAARAARLAGDFETAEKQLREAHRLQDPPSDEAVLESAMFHAAGGDLDKYESFLLEIVRRRPDRAAPVREALASGYMRSYRVLDTLNLLGDWLNAEPNAAEALSLRGDLYWQIGARGKAVDDYRRAVELDPLRRRERERLAVGLIENGRYEEALKQLYAVRQWKPEDPMVETQIARCLEGLNQAEQARQALDGVVARHPDFGPALRQRGQMMMQAGKPAEAEEWLRRAALAMPLDYQTNWALGDALEKAGKPEEAKAQLARAQRMKDRDDRFLEITTRQMNMRPRDPALHCELGQLFLERGLKDLGEQWLLSALSLAPHNRKAHEALAKFYDEQGDEEKAASHRAEAAAAKSSEAPPATRP